LGGVYGHGFLGEDVLASFEREADVLVVVRVWCGDVYDVYVFIVDELLVGAVGFCGAGGVELS
jgi:hypothetical protein